MASRSYNPGAVAVLGAATGARSLAGAAALALHGRPRSTWARVAILTLAAGEAVADKLPVAPPRSDPPGLIGRGLAGAAVGAATASWRGAAIGSACALAVTYPSQRGRALVGERTGLPDQVVALAEDVVTYGVAYAAAGAALAA